MMSIRTYYFMLDGLKNPCIIERERNVMLCLIIGYELLTINNRAREQKTRFKHQTRTERNPHKYVEDSLCSVWI